MKTAWGCLIRAAWLLAAIAAAPDQIAWAAETPAKEVLRAGAAAADIGLGDPDRPIHDVPQVKVLVVDNGQTHLAIVCLDTVGVSSQLTAAIRKQVEQQAGIEPQRVLVNASHNHHGDPYPIDVEVQGLRIGPFVLVTFPGEPFVEVGLNIKQRSPFPGTFVAGYSNGHLGYAPTADAYADEAYEDVNTRFGPQWQTLFECKALEIIGQLLATAPD